MSKLEAALFYLFDSGVLVGALVAHVDDLYSTGTGKKHEECLKFLRFILRERLVIFVIVERT